MILAFLACSWLVYAYANRNWLDAFDQVLTWFKNPSITYTSMPITGVPLAFLATLEVLFVGVASGYLLLNNEKDLTVKLVTVLGLGFGLTGLITIILGITNKLYQTPLNTAIFVVSAACLGGILYQKKIREKRSFKELFRPHFNLALPGNRKFWVPAATGIVVLFFFVFYHALLTVVVHWDATVYHAAMATIMYNDHGIPVIAGPSIGIEMSANFPPLFSSLGAFYYIQIGAIEDFFLRAIPPVMGLLTVLATYKLGEVLHSKKLGVVAALFLAATPLFFRYSIYATSYSTLTFFCTVAILFLFYGIFKGNNKYWVASGVFLGFAALISYIALYLTPFFLLGLLYYFMAKNHAIKGTLKKAAILLVATVIIGGVWYARNQVTVGNPIYPNAYTVLGGADIDPIIMNTTVNGIKLSAATSYFGVSNATVFDQVTTFITYRTSFPAISLITVLAFALIPFENKKFWLVAFWPLSLTFIILSGISWGFPRHFMVTMPGFAVLSALPIIKALNWCKTYEMQSVQQKLQQAKRRFSFIRKTNFLRLGIVVILLVAFLFPSLTLIIGGKVYEENLADQVPKDYLWFLEHPNADTWTVLNMLYPEAPAWQYINANLTQGQKVGTVENRIYYVKNCSNDYFFYLDGWEARDLYNITNPAQAVQFLRQNNVTIIVDVAWAREHGHFEILPMAKYLGLPSPFFPTIFSNNSNPAIYNVGPFRSPLTDNSTDLVSISQNGWGEVRSIDGVKTQTVIAKNDSSKLYVATPSLMCVNITYLDYGKSPVSINVHNFETKNWTNGYTTIQRNNTGKWANFGFILPADPKGYVELGLHAFGENLTVANIEVSPYQSMERPVLSSFNGTIVNGTLSMNLTRTTLPESLMFYLPIPNGTESVSIYTDSYGKEVGIEIYEGIIQPSETTNWWTRHDFITRSPTSVVYGALNPSMIWQPEKPGYYTLVVVLREYWKDDPRMDIAVSTLISSNSTVTTQTTESTLNGHT